MALRTSADNAEDVAMGFSMFRDPLPEHATEITSLMADLFAISVSLKSLDELASTHVYSRIVSKAQPDVDLICSSLKYTLEDVVDFFGKLELRSRTTRAYKQTWVNMCAFFKEETDESLSTRLAKYKVFLHDMQDMVKGKPADAHVMARLRANLKALLLQQESYQAGQLAPRLGRINIGGTPSNSSDDPNSPVERIPRRRRSYERRRPTSSMQSPQSPLSPSSGTFSSGSQPSGPDAALVPRTDLFPSNAMADHWAKTVFSHPHATTRMPHKNESSRCFGDTTHGAKQWLREQGFEELFQLAFTPDSDMRVFMFCRGKDHRARMLCKVPNNRRNEYSCLPLNLLVAARVGSCLQLRRPRRERYEIWVNLKFATLERMVLFYYTFLALRAQDNGRQVETAIAQDYELDDEVQLFGGQILDDDFHHALRIYQDTITGAIRLVASVHRGELKRCPVWTAFITEHVHTRGWIRRSPTDPKILLIREMQKNIFAFDNYSPPMNLHGEHIIKFTNRSDAQAFLENIANFSVRG